MIPHFTPATVYALDLPPALPGVKVPKRVVIPLSIDDVARFWSIFRTSRNLAIVGMILLQGLRSCEVLALNRDDLILSEAQIRVLGNGNKVRLLSLAPETETIELLDHYLRLERPTHCGSPLFCFAEGPRARKPDRPQAIRSDRGPAHKLLRRSCRKRAARLRL